MTKKESVPERTVREWLAFADELMKDDPYWLHPYNFDPELNELLLKRTKPARSSLG